MSSVEQERKYLILNESWRENIVHSIQIKQAYLDLTQVLFTEIDNVLSVHAVNGIYHFQSTPEQFNTLNEILSLNSDRTVLRIRSVMPLSNLASSEAGFVVTVKGPVTGDAGLEAEFTTLNASAQTLFSIGNNIIHKIRHLVHYQGYDWEVDEFQDGHLGLILAEVENHDYVEFPPSVSKMPPWIGLDVTNDYRYRNNNLGKYGLTQIRDQSIPGF